MPLPPVVVPVLSLILLPSISPRNPRFCSPITLLSSPLHTKFSLSLPPISEELHSEPLWLVVADSSSLGGRLGCCTFVLRLRPSVRAWISEEKLSLAPWPKEKSDVAVGEPTGSRVPTKKLGLSDPSIPRPPPAAIAVALNTAAAFRLSSRA